MDTGECRIEEYDEEGAKEWGLNGIFVVVWRKNPSSSAGIFDRDSQLWRGQSVGEVYAAAFGSPTRVQDSDGECHRCLLESVDIEPLEKIPLLEAIIDGLKFFFYVMVGKDTEHCETPERFRQLPFGIGRILDTILRFLSQIISYITEFFTGQERPDVCERRPILTRVDVGLTYGLGLEGKRSQITTYVLDLLDKYNGPAKKWNERLDDLLNTVPDIWTYFPDVKEVLLKLRLPIYEEPNLTGPLF